MVEGELAFLVGLYARVGEVAVAVDGEHYRVGQEFYAVCVVAVAIDRVGLAVRWCILQLEVISVVGVYGLIGNVVVI